MKDVLCIYHSGPKCWDGFASAYVVGRYFGFENVEFMALNYGDPVPDLTNRLVFIVDFSFAPAPLYGPALMSRGTVMLDHHATAIAKWDAVPQILEALKGKLKFVHDLKKSGVGLTWEYLFPLEPMPMLLQHIQDYDLWNFDLPDTKAVMAVLDSKRLTVEEDFLTFKAWVNTFADVRESVCMKGHAVLEYRNNLLIDLIKRTYQLVDICGYKVPMIPLPHDMADEGGKMLCQDVPFSVTYEDRPPVGKRFYSFRSNENNPNHADVGELCRRLGGGGHKHAAGIPVDLGTIVPWLKPAE